RWSRSPRLRATPGSSDRAGGRCDSLVGLRQLTHARDRRRQEPEHAGDRADRGDPERRPQPDPGAERAAGESAERPHAVVDDHVRAGDTRPQPVRHERGGDRVGRDVEQHHAEARDELGHKQAGVDRPVAAAGERHQHERRRKEHRAGDHHRADTEAATQAPGHERAEHPAERAGAEHEPEHAGPHAQRARRVEDEQRPEDEVEEVDRRRREQLRADDRRVPDVTHPRLQVASPGLLGRRLLRVDRVHRQRREDERERVHDERDRRREHLHQQTAEARPGDVRERAAAVQPRARLEVALARHQRDEERAVGDGEEQVRKEQRGAEVAHLGRARVQRQHADQRQRDLGRLVAEERHRLAHPEAAEIALLEGAGEAKKAPRSRRDDRARNRIVGVHARATVMSPLIVLARSSTLGPLPSGGRSVTGSSERTSPERERAATQRDVPSRMPTLRSPDADLSVTLPLVTAPICWSPEAVFTPTDELASRTSTSPEAELTESSPLTSRRITSPEAELILASPPIERICTSPDAVFSFASPPIEAIWTSPLAALTCASPATSPNSTSPEPVSTSTEPKRPWPSMSAEPDFDSTLVPSGQVTETSTSALRKIPRPRSRTSITTSWPLPRSRSSTRAFSTAA